MEWTFTIIYDRRLIRLRAKIVFLNDQTERILVQARNKHIVLQSNRPFLEAKGLKQKRINWKIIEGTINHSMVLQLILRKVEAQVRGISNKEQGVLSKEV